MLAQLASRLPSGALWRYEPKLDGFRGLLEHAADGELRITSRNRQDLTRWFPGIARAGGYLPAATVLDGELVVVDENGQPNFGALQARLTMTPERIADAVVGCPAVPVVFDVLQLGGNSLVDCPLNEQDASLVRTGFSAARPYGWTELEPASVQEWRLDAYIPLEGFSELQQHVDRSGA